MIFTASAVAAPPIKGYLLADVTGAPLWEGWLGMALPLYGVAGAC